MRELVNINILEYTPDVPINLVVTSPPYNLGIEYDNWNDNLEYSTYIDFTESWLRKMYDILPSDGRLCVNIPVKITMPSNKMLNIPLEAVLINIALNLGFQYHNTIIWDKGNIVKTCWGSRESASSPFIRDNIECIIVLYKKVWKRLTKGTSTIGKEFYTWTQSLWRFSGVKRDGHPAPFPLELALRCIHLFSYQEDTILDPFIGSGTTALACEKTGRKWIGVDISKSYCNMAKARIENYRREKQAEAYQRELFG